MVCQSTENSRDTAMNKTNKTKNILLELVLDLLAAFKFNIRTSSRY